MSIALCENANVRGVASTDARSNHTTPLDKKGSRMADAQPTVGADAPQVASRWKNRACKGCGVEFTPWSAGGHSCSAACSVFGRTDFSGDCWVFTGFLRDGYGLLKFRGEMHLAHRISYEHAYGALKDGLFVCHECDNPACVNPGHLFAGTAADNARDCSKKDRTLFGTRSPWAKLTNEAVRYIRESDESIAALARRFGVSHRTVSVARSGETWKRA